MYNNFWENAEGNYYVTGWETDTAIWGWLIGTGIIYYVAHYFLKTFGYG